jgi:hypothetical protein
VSMGLICAGCRKRPEELEEYVVPARAAGISPDDFVRRLNDLDALGLPEEWGMLNARGEFLCTFCYVAVARRDPGWTVPL